MEIHPDFNDLLNLFNEQKVKYIIVGGYALAYHGAPRYTGDIDLWIKISQDNAEKVVSALNEFGFGSLGIKQEDFIHEDQVLQLGYPPVRIDIMTSIDGVNFDSAYKNAEKTTMGDLEIIMISKSDLIKNKKATSRHQDLADLESLGEL
ncbi:hypothetical protein LNTAR_12962 [Lentisphaera araneosa HTCC2155]|uniref:DUF6036 domain-containing protein n=1 Tax=Lentisphaera araneosa HTCC2155 TaxID=313628 RepID=A6DUH6_9BACT|nr:DUF6036 family nucleotidyltransferase [Lentisphaera araneosa]EDM24711.1 hypothetical protein LNTAR_12962 [Lentisphaera araneosa HTCC2155]